MNKSRAVLLGILVLCVGGYGIHFYIEARAEALEKEAIAQRVSAARAAAAQQAAQRVERRLMEDASMVQAVPRGYPRPVSDWQANEKAFHEKILAGGGFDVLVVPFQVMSWAVDRSTRSLMTAELSAAIAQAQKVKMPDPFLVGRALGDGQRQIRQEDVYKLADSMGAKRVIWGYAGHDRKGYMAITLHSQEYVGTARGRGPWTSPVKKKRFEKLPFDEGRPPIEVYESLMPELLKELGLDASTPIHQRVEGKLDTAELPVSPKDLIASGDNPARDAYAFLLFSQLTPNHIDRTRERFAEKAYLALLRLSPDSPEYRALRARIYMALGFRVAALKALGEPQTDEERVLHAALNGNLPLVRSIAMKEGNQLKRLLQKLDEIAIGSAYGVINQKQAIAEAQALKLPGQIWPYIATRSLVDWDAWSQFDNGTPKMILDLDLPVKGYSLEEVVRGMVSLGDPGKIQAVVDLSVLNHTRKFIEADAARWGGEAAFNRLDQLDYLELLQAIGNDNLMRRIRFLSQVQGRPDAAISLANGIDTLYKGYPYYALERSRAEADLARHASPAEKDGLLKSSFEQAFNAMYWEQGQSRIASLAAEQVISLRRSDFGTLDNFYHTDIPFRPYYWTWASGGNLDTFINNNLAALSNATREFAVVTDLAGQYQHFFPDDGKVDALLKSIEGRFVGSPQKNELLGKNALDRGDTRSAAAFFRDNIQLAPNYWDSYEALGRLLYRAGEVTEAFKVVRSYPGFSKNSGESRVAIANNAYEMGSYFYWSGHFDLAEPLYRISASQRTGAAAEISSDSRLKLLAGDIKGALAGSLTRAQRYNDTYAYRDYLGMLFATGYSKEAWAGFGVLARESPKPHIWETALVGHHISGVSEAEVVEWSRQSQFKDAGEKKNAAAVYALRFGTTDRIPSKELSEAVNHLDRPVVQLANDKTIVVRPSDDGSTGELVGLDALGGKVLSMQLMTSPADRRRVKSDLAYFVEGYRELKLKNFAAAKASFDQAATLYDLTAQSIYMLPYFALSAAKAGDGSGVEKVMARIKEANQGFDYFLAKALLAATAGKTDEALKSLQRARYLRPHTEGRPLLTQYTYGEVSELVAELTGSGKARDLALDWARKFQRIEPWHSWSYAIEAKLSTSTISRKRAVAMLYYLDPKSDRLSRIKKSEIDAAVKAFGGSNPFLLKMENRKTESDA